MKRNSVLLAISNPEIAKQFDKEKNEPITLIHLTSGSNRKVWWKCSFGHSWQAMVNNRVQLNRGCPYCSNKLASPDNNLKSKFFLVAQEWHPERNGALTPEKVVFGSAKKVWWKCSNQHEWMAKIYLRTLRGHSCPYCSGRLASNENNLEKTNPLLIREGTPLKI